MSFLTTSNFDFEHIIRTNTLYIDKTDYIHKLVCSSDNSFFLLRPRRFGKSLTISTLKYLFQGRQDLFRGLKIDALPYDWKSYPVIHLNMAQLNDSSLRQLEIEIVDMLQVQADLFGVELRPNMGSGMMFRHLIRAVAQNSDSRRVVVLVDEYDKPLVENIGKPHLEDIRNVLENFYIQIKACNDVIHFTFITGVTRFSKVSIFSKLNHLNDISLSLDYATMLGYTQQEVEEYFGTTLQQLASQAQEECSVYKEEVRRWYNGFRFHRNSETVYNPVSLGSFINNKGDFRNYWFATGSPMFIFKLLKFKESDFFDSLNDPLREDLLDSFDPATIMAAPLLYQTGYLTIKRSQQINGLNALWLGYPNYEIESSFNTYFASFLMDKEPQAVGTDVFKLQVALNEGNTEELHRLLYCLLASIPYGEKSDMERSYQNLMFLMFRMIGAEIHNEVQINNGRVDAIVENKDRVYVLEYKMDTPALQAIEQIKAKGYFHPYIGMGKEIVLIGINFGRTERNIREWEVETIPSV